MSNQSAIFVDAGFLHSVGAQRTASTSYRQAVKLQYSTLVRGITNAARAHSGVSNLRTYWYDASKDGLLTDEHKKVAMIPGVKVRLGRLNFFGEQKGVDLRLALDLVGLARTGSASVAYLISGDDDLTEAVEEAQSLGMRVVLLGIADESTRIGVTAVAENLAFTVDAIELLSDDLLEASFTRTVVQGDDNHSAGIVAAGKINAATASAEHVTTEGGITVSTPTNTPRIPTPAALASRPPLSTQVSAPRPAPSAARSHRPGTSPDEAATTIVYSSITGSAASVAGPSHNDASLIEIAEEVGAKVARNWYANTTQAELSEVFADRPQLPPFIDRVLIKDCAAAIGETDTYLQSVRRALRGSFWDEIDTIH
ncbi:NYN domain-containing protein [Jonesia quinghaiensis]|uniref:NYN domain-containing protein n=1 Tax=Jonesia quinghaiensis TaxID=262806 RepID=UPI000417CDD3|nr:NYN domain-containing protein [Jonesia quinghaiensis]